MDVRPVMTKIRIAKLSMYVGALVFVGGCAVVALGSTPVGAVIIALGVACPAVGCLVLLRLRSQVLAEVKRARAEQLAAVDEFLRRETDGT